MSLLHRKSSVGAPARRLSRIGDDNRGRRMSFNPVGESVPQIAHDDPIGAYEVSRSWRISQVATAVTYCLFSAGIVFGFAALKPVLLQEGVYRDQCTNEELSDEVEICTGQEIKLNVMFTAAAVATNVCALPVGFILDRYGPRLCSMLGCLFIAIGCLLLAFASDLRRGDGYIPGYLFLALGGPFIFISSFQLSNAFPRRSGLILALITGAFDTSSAVFLLYRLIYEASYGMVHPKGFFFAYLAVPILIAVSQYTVMPPRSYKTVSELVKHAQDDTATATTQSSDERQRRDDVISETTALLKPTAVDDADPYAYSGDAEDHKRAISGVWGVLHGRTAAQQLVTPWFILIVFFTIVQMLRLNFFIATVRPQYSYLLDSNSAARTVNSFFDIALPLGGIFAIPVIGFVLDNTSTAFVLGLLVSLATLIGVLGCLTYTWSAYANVVLFVLYRPFFYTAISNYAAEVFGFVTFGKVYGLLVCLAGLFNFLQTPLDQATHRRFDNDPRPVNLILLVVGAVVGLMLVGYVWTKSRSMQRELLEQEAEASEQREQLIPGHDERVHEDRHPMEVHPNQTPGDSVRKGRPG